MRALSSLLWWIKHRWIKQLRRSLAVVLAGVLVLMTTACSQPDTTAQAPDRQPVTEATEAAIDRAQSNLSDTAVDENVLSQQSPSQAKKTDGTTVAP